MFFSRRPLDWAVGGEVVKSEMDVGRELKIWLDFRVRLSICLPAMRKVLSTRDRYACDDPRLGTQKVYYGKKIHPLNANLRREEPLATAPAHRRDRCTPSSLGAQADDPGGSSASNKDPTG